MVRGGRPAPRRPAQARRHLSPDDRRPLRGITWPRRQAQWQAAARGRDIRTRGRPHPRQCFRPQAASGPRAGRSRRERQHAACHAPGPRRAGRARRRPSTTPKHDWDLAAGDLLVHEAGGTVTGLDGKRFIYNRPETRQANYVASSHALHAALLKHTRVMRTSDSGH